MSDARSEEQQIELPDELSSTIDADTDTEALRNGGPTRTPGVITTTGGTAGPNSFRPRPNGAKGAPITTDDAPE